MNYVVLDLEWNQANGITEHEVPAIPFEIIEIGAVKLQPLSVSLPASQITLMSGSTMVSRLRDSFTAKGAG